MSRKLLLFDIDGTLMWTHGAGRVALERAVAAVYGIPDSLATVPLAGSTDLLALNQALTAAGLSQAEIEAGWPAFLAAAPRFLTEAMAGRKLETCPGVPELLAHLRLSVQQNGTVMGLVTGNMERTAHLKLAAVGIDPAQFVVGAYGSEAADRNLLPPLAIRRARDLTGQLFSGQDVVVIGDTPADIACGQVVAARTIGVATGPFDVATLAAADADFVFENLRNLDAVAAALLD